MKMRLGRIGLVAAAAASAGWAGVSRGAVVLTGTYNSGSGYQNASSLPVSSTDLIQGLTPTASTYVGCCEDSGSTNTSPLNDGKTAADTSNLSETTGPANSLFAGSPFDVTYQLPATPSGGGYDLTSIVVTTGHQDARVNQNYDILVSSNGTTFTTLSTGGGFQYSPSTTGTGGAAQSTLTSDSGPLASGVRFVRFHDNDGQDVYRELDVNGTPTAVPEPASLGVLALGGLGLLARRRRPA